MQKDNMPFKYCKQIWPPEFRFFLVFIFAIISPFFLLLLEKTIFPYPAILEESFKAIVIICLITGLSRPVHKLAAAALFGFLIGLSENMFYIFGGAVDGFQIFGQRMLIVTPMHMLTTVLILLFTLFKHKHFIIFGWLLAIIIHALFNNYADRLARIIFN